MKNFSFFALILLLSATMFSACDAGKLPNIAFKTGGNYVSGDKTVGKGDTVLVGIKASKAEDKDVLKTFSESVSLDGGASSTLLNESLSGSQGDSYEKDIQIVTRKQIGTEKYTFTVVNRDGLINSVTLTLTTN